jgi:hypothetical protein
MKIFSTNLDERRVTGVVFLDVAKAFATVWVENLQYKLTIFNFSLYLVETISYLKGWEIEENFQKLTFTIRVMRAGVEQVVLFHLYCVTCM